MLLLRTFPGLVLLLLITNFAEGNAVRKKERHKRPSVQPIHSISLADRWRELQQPKTTSPTFQDDGFLLYLQQQEKRKERAIADARNAAKHAERLFLWRTVVWSALIIGGASALQGDLALSLWKDLKHTTGMAVAVNLASTVYHQVKSGRRIFGSSNSQQHNPWYLLLLTVFSPNLWYYIWQTILPSTARTIRQMMVSELWNRLFSRLFAVVGTLIFTALRSNDDDMEGGDDTHALTWIEHDRSFLAMALKRGTRKLFQSVLQRHLNQAILSLWRYATDAVQGAVQQLFPFDG